MATSVLAMNWVPTPTDGLQSDTLTAQLDAEQEISSLLTTHMTTNGSSAVLHRAEHVAFLSSFLRDKLHSAFTALDASRPWLLYWCIHSLALLDRQVDDSAQDRVIATLASCHNPKTGGYGGGPGQLSHLAPSYATVSTLCYMGQRGWDSIDRRAQGSRALTPGMYKFLMSLKQPDGSFIMHKGGEVDVRGCYCALVIASLLNMLTPELAHNTSQFIASCQTYEGGLASSAATVDSATTNAPPLGEAHGGYAFCALASYAMLRPLDDPNSPANAAPRTDKTRKRLDLDNLLRWSCSMQAMPIEGGGFRGRTNKLVDGCYSLWCGGLFGLLGGLIAERGLDFQTDLYDRSALQEYVLYAAQAPRGGLRDKPGKHPDGYHTCYNLSGLTAAQHQHVLERKTVEAKRTAFVSPFSESGVVDVDGRTMANPEMMIGDNESQEQAQKRMREQWSRAVAWQEGEKMIVGDQGNEVLPAHPIFNLVQTHCLAMLNYFYRQA
ncbi:CAAX farnesyltransferase (FTase) subunit beta [Microbotryomycetes sp. JL201]|nr:CAAX farnesyltransferase (FTase) subunit beta [Microbotryomycetes sp. JL201]